MSRLEEQNRAALLNNSIYNAKGRENAPNPFHFNKRQMGFFISDSTVMQEFRPPTQDILFLVKVFESKNNKADYDCDSNLTFWGLVAAKSLAESYVHCFSWTGKT